MATQSDFLYIGQPHDPYTISGSDPYNDISGLSVMAVDGDTHCSGTYSASLACWYSAEAGWVLTASTKTPLGSNFVGAGDLYGAVHINAMIDRSGNEFGDSAYEGAFNQHTFKNINGRRYLRRGAELYPQLSQSGYLPGDQEQYVTNRDNNTDGIMLRNDEWQLARGSWRLPSTWISINRAYKGGDESNQRPGPHSSFFTAMFVSEDNDNGHGFGAVYGHDSYAGRSDYGWAYTGPFVQTIRGGSVQNYYLVMSRARRTAYSVIGGHHESTYRYNNHNGWHALSMVYDSRQPGNSLNNNYFHVTAAYDGEVIFNGDTRECDSYAPYTPNPSSCNQTRNSSGDNINMVRIGAHSSNGPEMAGDDRADSRCGFMDYFVFESALSPQRRQQMERFQCDRAGILMRDTYWLSEFYGGPQGAPHLHSAITTNTLSGLGSYCRKYVQEPTASGHPKIHYETAAGSFFKKSVNGGAFQSVTGSTAVRLEAWVRAENIDATDHAGSQIALVAAATTPYGNQMDNIRGYAVKFGTFKDAADTDSLKIRLSTRDSDTWNDGSVNGDESQDIDLSPSFSVIANKWYQIRLDVNPVGHLYDVITASAREGASDSWEQLTVKTVYPSSSIYRFPQDTPYNLQTRMPAPCSKYNGYYVAVSSSTGNRVDTTYFIDNFTMSTKED